MSVGVKFLLVGGLSTLIEVLVFNLCLLGFGWDVVTSKIVASLVALVNAYIGNRYWAFRTQAGRGRASELVYFLAVNLFCLVLGTGLVWVGVEGVLLSTGEQPGPIVVNLVNLVSILIVVVVRFVLYHWVVFRPSDPAQAEASLDSR